MSFMMVKSRVRKNAPQIRNAKTNGNTFFFIFIHLQTGTSGKRKSSQSAQRKKAMARPMDISRRFVAYHPCASKPRVSKAAFDSGNMARLRSCAMQPSAKKRLVNGVILAGGIVNAIVIVLILYYFVI